MCVLSQLKERKKRVTGAKWTLQAGAAVSADKANAPCVWGSLWPQTRRLRASRSPGTFTVEKNTWHLRLFVPVPLTEMPDLPWKQPASITVSFLQVLSARPQRGPQLIALLVRPPHSPARRGQEGTLQEIRSLLTPKFFTTQQLSFKVGAVQLDYRKRILW